MAGKKILMWQGTADQLIQTENSLNYYESVANYFSGGTPDFSVLQPWFRYFRHPVWLTAVGTLDLSRSIYSM